VCGASSRRSPKSLARLAATIISISAVGPLATVPASAQAQTQAQTQAQPQQERGFFGGAMQRLVNALPFSGVFSSRPTPETRAPAGAARPQPLPGGQSLLPPPPIPPASIPGVASPDADGAPLALAPPTHSPATTTAPAPPT